MLPYTDNLNAVKAAKQLAVTRYLNKPSGRNIVAIGIGSKIIDGVDTGVLALRIYVGLLRVAKDLPPADLIPTEILGVPTDVIAIGRKFSPSGGVRKRRDDSPPDIKLGQPGSSIGPKVNGLNNVNPMTAGTLGAVLQDESDPPKKYILSCNHVLSVKDRIRTPTDIVSPAVEDGLNGTPIATYGVRENGDPGVAHSGKTVLGVSGPIERKGNGAQEENEVDCAVALVTSDLVDPVFPGGLKVETTAVPARGQRVIKFGKSTGRTVGKIVDVDADVLVDYSFGTFRFINQILVEGDTNNFAADGDSGAVLITKDTHEAVGILFAPSGKLNVACPFGRALEVLGKKLNTTLALAK